MNALLRLIFPAAARRLEALEQYQKDAHEALQGQEAKILDLAGRCGAKQGEIETLKADTAKLHAAISAKDDELEKARRERDLFERSWKHLDAKHAETWRERDTLRGELADAREELRQVHESLGREVEEGRSLRESVTLLTRERDTLRADEQAYGRELERLRGEVDQARAELMKNNALMDGHVTKVRRLLRGGLPDAEIKPGSIVEEIAATIKQLRGYHDAERADRLAAEARDKKAMDDLQERITNQARTIGEFQTFVPSLAKERDELSAEISRVRLALVKLAEGGEIGAREDSALGRVEALVRDLRDGNDRRTAERDKALAERNAAEVELGELKAGLEKAAEGGPLLDDDAPELALKAIDAQVERIVASWKSGHDKLKKELATTKAALDLAATERDTNKAILDRWHRAADAWVRGYRADLEIWRKAGTIWRGGGTPEAAPTSNIGQMNAYISRLRAERKDAMDAVYHWSEAAKAWRMGRKSGAAADSVIGQTEAVIFKLWAQKDLLEKEAKKADNQARENLKQAELWRHEAIAIQARLKAVELDRVAWREKAEGRASVGGLPGPTLDEAMQTAKEFRDAGDNLKLRLREARQWIDLSTKYARLGKSNDRLRAMVRLLCIERAELRKRLGLRKGELEGRLVRMVTRGGVTTAVIDVDPDAGMIRDILASTKAAVEDQMRNAPIRPCVMPAAPTVALTVGTPAPENKPESKS